MIPLAAAPAAAFSLPYLFCQISIMTAYITDAVRYLCAGEVIAYATEAVFGLGCDPDNEAAVTRLLAIKQRPREKGLILIAADWEQLRPYVDEARLPEPCLRRVLDSWPGPFTWILPARVHTPTWLTGRHDTLAVRVTDHPQVRQLCREFGKPLVSTSANLAGDPPCRTVQEVSAHLGHLLAFILPGEVGGRLNPSLIRDALTGQVIRPA